MKIFLDAAHRIEIGEVSSLEARDGAAAVPVKTP